MENDNRTKTSELLPQSGVLVSPAHITLFDLQMRLLAPPISRSTEDRTDAVSLRVRWLTAFYPRSCKFSPRVTRIRHESQGPIYTRMYWSGDPWISLVFGSTGYRITLRHRWSRNAIRCFAPPTPSVHPDTRNNLGPGGSEIDTQSRSNHVTSGLAILRSGMGPRHFPPTGVLVCTPRSRAPDGVHQIRRPSLTPSM